MTIIVAGFWIQAFYRKMQVHLHCAMQHFCQAVWETKCERVRGEKSTFRRMGGAGSVGEVCWGSLEGGVEGGVWEVSGGGVWEVCRGGKSG